MASLIKNRILKHLSKFTKNLSTDRINVSTLKGEGELTDLELNEEVLTDLLELPVWIRLSKAICNKVSCKIIWTKLKSVPIYLNLDEVLVEMETCEELRKQGSHSVPNYSSGGKYGFTDKVIDGMTVTVNSVVINFKSTAFHASFQLSRLRLDSRTPLWQQRDLRMTRLKEPDQGALLIFKQLEWQTLRVEATAVSLPDELSTPLRLITNQARCRITIKKRLSDCSVLGSRLVLILEELLWVLTDSQLKAALHFVNSLSGLIQRATALAQKTKGARKLESSPDWQIQQAAVATPRPQTGHAQSTVDSVLSRVFSTYDVHETSYHFCSGQIDLHLCDDVTPEGVSSTHPQLSEGGAIQITLHNLSVDYYPYHMAGGNRRHWIRYKENSTARSTWVSSLLSDFRARLMEILPGESPRAHVPVHRTQPHTELNKRIVAPTKATLGTYLARLMSVCVVVRIDDFTIFSVSTPGTRNGFPTKFVTNDKGRLLLPPEMAAVHLELTQYYYPGDSSIPVPLHNVFVQVNPVHVTYDPVTILWLSAFSLGLHRSQMMLQTNTPAVSPGVDVRLEALMPRIVFVDDKDHPNQPDRPNTLQIQISRLTVTNSRVGDSCGRMELGKCLETLQTGDLFFGSSFPSKPGDAQPVVDAFVHHVLSTDRKMVGGENAPGRGSPGHQEEVGVHELFSRMDTELLREERRDVWCVLMDPVWADFTLPNDGTFTRSGKPRPIPFLDAFPLTLWVHQRSRAVSDASVNDIHVVAHVPGLVNIQLNHYQYLFILRVIENVSEMTRQLTEDTCRLVGVPVDESARTCLAVLLPEVDISLLMPVDVGGGVSGVGMAASDGLNSDSVTPDDVGFRQQFEVQLSMKESISEQQMSHGGDSERGSMTKSISDSLLDAPTVQSMDVNGSDLTQASPSDSGLPMTASYVGGGRKPSSTDWSQLDRVVPDNLTRTLATGSSVMKKGFTNLMSSIDSAFSAGKVNMDKKPSWSGNVDGMDGGSAEDWETLSVRSDLSSDSDQFMMVHLDSQTNKLEDALFAGTATPSGKVERASEMKEESLSTPSSCSVKRLDLVSSLTLRLGRVQMIQESQGNDSTHRLVCSHIVSEEDGTMTWDEFQTKFSARSRGWNETRSTASLTPCVIRMRYAVGPRAELTCPTAGERGVVTAVMSDVNLSLMMSSVVGLPALIEDEIIPLPMPLRIYLTNINIHFQEDRPATNVTSPGPIPLDVVISKMAVIRNADGIFRMEMIQNDAADILKTLSNGGRTIPTSFETLNANFSLRAGGCSSKPKLATSTPSRPTMIHVSTVTDPDGAGVTSSKKPASRLESLLDENEQLRIKLMVLDTLQHENDELREQVAMETARAKSVVQRLAEVEQEVRHLEEEKQTLIATRQVLQEELLSLESRHISHNATG